MTHMRQYGEHEGVFTKSEPADRPCQKCGKGPVTYSLWESHDGAYEDAKYECQACRYVWWIDGPDG